jgi:membrane protein insertase Oxa1/YidC/SpoIIIJ
MQRQMALYKKYGVNPMGGCLYALLPIPFLILVYNAFLVYQVQFPRGALFVGEPRHGGAVSRASSART